ncbi:MAG: hypothetical protein HQK51_11350 [Oligoflexia bacterium]|nr:hypothetical protein [Oligoflexia bacterium]
MKLIMLYLVCIFFSLNEFAIAKTTGVNAQINPYKISYKGVDFILENAKVFDKYIYMDDTIVGEVNDNNEAIFDPDYIIYRGDKDGFKSIIIDYRYPENNLDSALEQYPFNNKLLPYTLAAPNQLGAGSCLYMATTGAVELLVNQQKNITYDPNLYDGDYDFSERYLMNLYVNGYNNLYDLVYKINVAGGMLLNKDYRFTMGYYKKNLLGKLVKTYASDKKAIYGETYNWINEYSNSGLSKKIVPLNKLDRELIFTNSNRWNVGVMSGTTVQKIKDKLDQYKAPVVVIYNHYGYWHAVVIVGYNDNVEIAGCPFVDSTLAYFKKNGNNTYYNKIVNAKKKDGGCNTSRGVFYIRDSIYNGREDRVIYNYDLNKAGEEKYYAARIIKKSYHWIKYLGNNAFVIKWK